MSAVSTRFDPAARFAWVDAPARWSREITLADPAVDRDAEPCVRCGYLAVFDALAGDHVCENCGATRARAIEPGTAARGLMTVQPRAPVLSRETRAVEAAGIAELEAALASAQRDVHRAIALPDEALVHAHQTRALAQIVGPLAGRAVLADEPGLGKTASVAMALAYWRARGMVSSTLVLAPRHATTRWGATLERHGCPGFYQADRLRSLPEHERFVLAPWGLIDRGDAPALLAPGRWDVLVADEAESLVSAGKTRREAVAQCDAPRVLLVVRDLARVDLRGLDALATLVRACDATVAGDPVALRARLAASTLSTRRSAHDVKLAERAIGRLDVAVNAGEAALWMALRTAVSRARSQAARARALMALEHLTSSVAALSALLASSTRAPWRSLEQTAREAGPGASVRGLALALRELEPLVDGPVAALASYDATAQAAREALATHRGLLPYVCAGPRDLAREDGPHGAAAVRACRALVHVDLPLELGALERRVARVLHAGARRERPVPVLAVCTEEALAQWFALHADASTLGGLGPWELSQVERSLGGRDAAHEQVRLAIAEPSRFDAFARACSVARAALRTARAAESVDARRGPA